MAHAGSSTSLYRYLGRFSPRSRPSGSTSSPLTGPQRRRLADLLNFMCFLPERCPRLGDVVATDLFDYLDWQQQRPRANAGKMVRLTTHRGAAPATMNR